MSDEKHVYVSLGIDTDTELPPEKKGSIKERLGVVACILLTELCERLTFYSIVANMVLFCTSKLRMTSDEASNVNWVFSGTVYIIPVAGGYVADSFAGKYNTILGAGFIYTLAYLEVPLVIRYRSIFSIRPENELGQCTSAIFRLFSGLVLVPASAMDYRGLFGDETDLSMEARKIYFFLGLVFVAIGTGGIKANVGPFGAQQVNDLGKDAVQSFFNWFYWFVNVGAIIAYSGVATIQQNIGFDYGFLVPLISMVVALIIFVIAKNKYRNNPPGGSILSESVRVCLQSCRKGCSFENTRADKGGSFNNEMVDGVMAVVRVLPVFVLIIIYWAVYSQMSTSLFLQSERMDIRVGGEPLPAALLNIFNTLIILILIPIMDRVVYPLLSKHGRSLTHLQKMGIGMILAALSMVYAGVIEIYRKKDGYFEQTLADDKFNASYISMFAQVPEFALIGSSEVFTSISGLEFAYSQAPSFMQGLVMGLFLMTSGLGNYVSTLIVTIVKAATKDDWFPKEPNDGHMEYLLFLIAGLMILNFMVFMLVARWYTHKTPELVEMTPGVTNERQEHEDQVTTDGYDNIGAMETLETKENTKL